MSEETITKRLHVSGLTPAITPADLSQKLGSFGSVKALDGFGALDVLGQPRKFGYVTIETTKPKLARCMNLLSGVTWKGAKLRIGEAKPDFRERLAAEREASEGEPPRKKRRLPRGVQGVHAADMSLVTPENVAGRGGWKVTPLGRLVKPIRMRPGKPLPEQIPAVKTAPAVKEKGKGKRAKDAEKVKKRRTKEPPSRARRRTIDPLKYGSQQLKGIFLENAAANLTVETKTELRVQEPVTEESSDESSSDEEKEDNGGPKPDEAMDDDEAPTHSPLSPVASSPKPQPPSPSSPPTRPPKPATYVPSDGTDLTQEKNSALGLLQSLFGGRDDSAWGDKESLGSDVDMDELAAQIKEMQSIDEDDGVEVVPIDVDERQSESSTEDGEEQGENIEAVQLEEKSTSPVVVVEKKSTSLKDLFAPREEEAGFSLLGHLDLDDELVEDLDSVFVPQAPITTAEPAQLATVPSTTTAQGRFTLDLSLPLFFPVPQDERTGSRGRVKDPLDVAKEKGWDWRGFCRTQTTEEIKQKWEEQKVELTKDWKRRHREAIKSRRRRGGAGDGE